MGYEIVLPAGAIPGWPADVVLPSDPVWKHDDADSVRRLVRDGVVQRQLTPRAPLRLPFCRHQLHDVLACGRSKRVVERDESAPVSARQVEKIPVGGLLSIAGRAHFSHDSFGQRCLPFGKVHSIGYGPS